MGVGLRQWGFILKVQPKAVTHRQVLAEDRQTYASCLHSEWLLCPQSSSNLHLPSFACHSFLQSPLQHRLLGFLPNSWGTDDAPSSKKLAFHPVASCFKTRGFQLFVQEMKEKKNKGTS